MKPFSGFVPSPQQGGAATSRRAGRCRLVAALLTLGVLVAVALQGVAEETLAPRPWRWSDVPRVVVIGDVHGAFGGLVGLLEGTALMAADGSWCGGDAHLVLLGDLLDRGSGERLTLDLVMRLQAEAAAAGGQVHMLLGNHEVMNLLGDQRYVSPAGYAAFAAEEDPGEREAARTRWMRANGYGRRRHEAGRAAFDLAFAPGYFARRQAFSPPGRYGRWLLEQDVLVVINDSAYVHGGLAPCLAEIDPAQVNALAMTELQLIAEARQHLLEHGIIHPETGYQEQRTLASAYVRRRRSTQLPVVQANVAAAVRVKKMASALVVRPDGPLWYRGSSLNPADEEASLTAHILHRLEAERVVVGHTPSHTGRVAVRFDGAVVMADTGMLTSHYKGRASAVIEEHGELVVYYPGEGVTPLPRSLPTASEELLRASAEELEDILRTARVVASEAVGSGASNPVRVTLEADGVRYRAIFKAVDTVAEVAADDAVHHGHPDRYQHEIAAYRVARLLGLDLVPPTVARRIGGLDGSLQLWVENAISEHARRDEDLQPDDGTGLRRQLQLVRIFDVLIRNPHRNSTNLLVTTHDWQLHLIDHAAAFSSDLSPLPERAKEKLVLDLDIVNRLRLLDRDELHGALSSLIGDDEIEALLMRRDRILAPWRAPSDVDE